MDREAWTRDTASHEKIMGMRSGVSTINGNAEPAVKPIASINFSLFPAVCCPEF